MTFLCTWSKKLFLLQINVFLFGYAIRKHYPEHTSIGAIQIFWIYFCTTYRSDVHTGEQYYKNIYGLWFSFSCLFNILYAVKRFLLSLLNMSLEKQNKIDQWMYIAIFFVHPDLKCKNGLLIIDKLS